MILEIKKCKFCGKTFIGKGKFCSRYCKGEALKDAFAKGVNWEWSEGNEPPIRERSSK